MSKVKSAFRIWSRFGFKYLVSFAFRKFLRRDSNEKTLEIATKIYSDNKNYRGFESDNKSTFESYSIIIPVFNGSAHIKKLLDGIEVNQEKIIIIDDCSTEEGLSEYLNCWVKKNGGQYHRNETNIGYIKSVNAAIKESDGDFILLNSDTEVFGDWSERLIHRLNSEEKIASVTPFSNSATIYSFPFQNQDNFLEQEIEELQLASEVNTDFPSLSAPTANGFCMAVKRSAWEEVGQFDEIKFPLGYGEECDWSMRAKRIGWRVVLAPDVFVKHLHGGSFNPTTKKILLKQSEKTIRTEWPQYFVQVENHLNMDPWANFRARIRLKLMLGNTWVIVFKTNLPGGAHNWFLNKINQFKSNGKTVLEVYQNEYGQIIGIPHGTWSYENEYLCKFEFKDWAELKSFQESFSSISEVVFSSLVGYLNPLEVVKIFGKESGNFAQLPGHDFFSLCPSHNLLNDKDIFCGLPSDLSICRTCLPKNHNANLNYRNVNIVEWRETWSKNTDAIQYFSKSSQDIFKISKVDFGEQTVNPHNQFSISEKNLAKDIFLKRQNSMRLKLKRKETLNIAYVGAFSGNKGSKVFLEIENIARGLKKDWKFHAFGRLYDHPSRHISHYEYGGVAQLYDLLEEHQIDLCIIPTIWPETYNYVLDELQLFGICVIVSPLGALAERISIDGLPFGAVASGISGKEFFNAIETYLLEMSDVDE